MSLPLCLSLSASLCPFSFGLSRTVRLSVILYHSLYLSTCLSLSDLYSRILNHLIIRFDYKFSFKLRNLRPIEGIIAIAESCVGERGWGNHWPRGETYQSLPLVQVYWTFYLSLAVCVSVSFHSHYSPSLSVSICVSFLFLTNFFFLYFCFSVFLRLALCLSFYFFRWLFLFFLALFLVHTGRANNDCLPRGNYQWLPFNPIVLKRFICKICQSPRFTENLLLPSPLLSFSLTPLYSYTTFFIFFYFSRSSVKFTNNLNYRFEFLFKPWPLPHFSLSFPYFSFNLPHTLLLFLPHKICTQILFLESRLHMDQKFVVWGFCLLGIN